jgi:hypothetical protein
MDIHTDDYKQYYTTAGNPVLWMYEFPPFSPSIHYVRQQSVDRSREHALVEIKALSAIEARATAAEAKVAVLETALRKVENEPRISRHDAAQVLSDMQDIARAALEKANG